MFFRKKPKQEVTPADVARRLKARPVRNAAAECVVERHDMMSVEVTLKYDGLMRVAASVMKLRQKKIYDLDGIGLAVFRQIDGKTTVDEILEKLKADEQLTFFEARGLVVKYLADLAGKGLIVLGVEE